MPDKWLTLAEAAAGLKVHPRTVERQIKSGKLQTRRADGGQLEVLVDLPDTATAGDHALSVVAGQAENQVQLALGATSAIVKTAQEDARLARLDADRAWEETHVARRSSMVAWVTVGVMAAALTLAVGWTSSTMTRSQVELQHAAEQTKQLADISGQLKTERDTLQDELADANQKRSRAEGELSGRVAADESTMAIALRNQVAAEAPSTQPSATPQKIASSSWQPTTQPTHLFEKIANTVSDTSDSSEDR